METLKVGFIDDEDTSYQDYAKRLKRRDIDLLLYEGTSDINTIVDWIINESILCVLIDYDLSEKFEYDGTDLVFEINQILPNFPCIMITNYPEESKNEELVPQRLIWDREIMNEDLSKIVDPIKNEIAVYLKRKNALYEQYGALAAKRIEAELTIDEEETFLKLHNVFSKYGETDDVPPQLLTTDTNKRLDSIIHDLSQLLDKKD